MKANLPANMNVTKRVSIDVCNEAWNNNDRKCCIMMQKNMMMMYNELESG